MPVQFQEENILVTARVAKLHYCDKADQIFNFKLNQALITFCGKKCSWLFCDLFKSQLYLEESLVLPHPEMA